MRFWIEHPKGKLWLHLNERVHGAECGIDPGSEIVACTFDDPSGLLAVIGESSGWFIRAGREVRFPFNQSNEVWTVTPLGLAAIKPPFVPPPSQRICEHQAVPVSSQVDIATVLSESLDRIKPSGFSALYLVRPDVLHVPNAAMKVMAVASNKPLRDSAHLLTVGPGDCGRTAFMTCLRQSNTGTWASTLIGMGYQSAAVLRVPAAGERFFEFVALSTAGFGTESPLKAAVFELMSSWPVWRQAIRGEFCDLSRREIAALRAASAGLNGAKASEFLGCTERTFRLHIDNAKRKLKSASAAEAAYKAQLICGL